VCLCVSVCVCVCVQVAAKKKLLCREAFHYKVRWGCGVWGLGLGFEGGSVDSSSLTACTTMVYQ
jgi:hypothetical protein